MPYAKLGACAGEVWAGVAPRGRPLRGRRVPPRASPTVGIFRGRSLQGLLQRQALLPCDAHAAHQHVGGAEYRKAAQGRPAHLVAEAVDGFEQLEKVARHGEGFDRLGALAVPNAEARALNREIAGDRIGPGVKALAFGDINAVAGQRKELLARAVAGGQRKAVGRDGHRRGISSPLPVSGGLPVGLFWSYG